MDNMDNMDNMNNNILDIKQVKKEAKINLRSTILRYFNRVDLLYNQDISEDIIYLIDKLDSSDWDAITIIATQKAKKLSKGNDISLAILVLTPIVKKCAKEAYMQMDTE
jgi:hypothetical protein